MKRIILTLTLCLPFLAIGQIPPGYYNTATGSGNTLRLALKNIIRPHTVLTYTPGLWIAYNTTDVKPSGKLWDMYSDIPGGTPAYQYAMGTDQCGSVSPTAEGSCYNREHTWPQSKFASDTPMQNDLFLVIPTDYYVNNQRGDLPYGKVGTASHTFTNGSKLGNNVYSGAPSGNCYEPIDSFKGDIARIYFYIATCYFGSDSTKFTNWEMANGISLKPWAIQMLLEWHHNDPVSYKEIKRNNAAYTIQNNRNPFIDHPEYADCIWGSSTACISAVNDLPQAQEAIWVSTTSNNTLLVDWHSLSQNDVSNVLVTDVSGRVVFNAPFSDSRERSATISTSVWPRGMYIVRVNCSTGVEVRKVVVQ